VSASADRICASLAADMPSRIWAMLLPCACAWTPRAWVSCSSLMCPRSSSSSSTALRVRCCCGAYSASASTCSSISYSASTGCVITFDRAAAALGAGVVFLRRNIVVWLALAVGSRPAPAGGYARPRAARGLPRHADLEPERVLAEDDTPRRDLLNQEPVD